MPCKPTRRKMSPPENMIKYVPAAAPGLRAPMGECPVGPRERAGRESDDRRAPLFSPAGRFERRAPGCAPGTGKAPKSRRADGRDARHGACKNKLAPCAPRQPKDEKVIRRVCVLSQTTCTTRTCCYKKILLVQRSVVMYISASAASPRCASARRRPVVFGYRTASLRLRSSAHCLLLSHPVACATASRARSRRSTRAARTAAAHARRLLPA